MAANIVITESIKEPWELKGTNYDKPEEIVLANLAVGQLAFIGSSFGGYLSRQATVTAELAEAVNTVRDRSAEVSALFSTWNAENPTLDLTMPASGPYPAQASMVQLNDGDVTDIDKLVAANNVISEYGVVNKFIPLGGFTSVDPVYESPCTFEFGPLATGEIITGFSPSLDVDNGSHTIPDFQLFAKLDSSGQVDKSKIFVNYLGNEYEAKNFKAIWIPSAQSEIDYFNSQLSFVMAGRNSRMLTDTTQLVPVPSEINNTTPDGADNLQQPAVTMEIAITGADFIEFKLEDGSYFYYDKPASEIPLFTGQMLDEYMGTVVKMPDNTYRFIAKTPPDSPILWVGITATPKPCIKNPTNLQQSEWLSQYSDKIVRITQRSSEQTTYVNALVQRYNYYFEAATNILKAFTNLWATLSGNI